VVSEAWPVTLANLAGLRAAGLATARVFGPRTAWWASLLFLVDPWAVYHGRLVWMQSYEPAFAAPFYACVLFYHRHARARRDRDRRGSQPVGGNAGPPDRLRAAVRAGGHDRRATGAAALATLAGDPGWPRAAVFVLTWIPFMALEWRTGLVDLAALRAALGQRQP
jgi:hypothetical protein